MHDDNAHGMHVRPIGEATSSEAKKEIEHYRSLGISDSDMGIVRDFPGGPETVVINKAGTVTLAKQSPMDGFTAIGKLREMGVNFILEEELDITLANPDPEAKDEQKREEREYMAGVIEACKAMTLVDLAKMRRDAAGKPKVRDGLGIKKFREYMDNEVQRLIRRFGRDVKLFDPVIRGDAHALTVVLNSFSIGDANPEGLEALEQKIGNMLRD